MFARSIIQAAMSLISGPPSRLGRRRIAGVGGGLFFILGGAISSGAIAQPLAAPGPGPFQAQPAVMQLSEVEAGQLLFKTGSAGGYQPALMLDSQAHFRVIAMVARVTLTQSFENATTDWQEGVYVFPLPEDAAVDAMRIRIGERLIEGQIREREEAKKIYTEARNSGRKASLVEQERPNLFTNSVANIGPGERVEVTIEYLQTVAYDHGRFELRLPLTITPRFFPGQQLIAADDDMQTSFQVATGLGWASNTDEVPDASRVSPPILPPDEELGGMQNPVRITGELNMGMPLSQVESRSHDIVLQRDQQEYQFNLLHDQVAMDRDFVLSWRPATGSEPRAALFSEAVDGEDYALLMIMPPQLQGPASTLPKEMIFIIDTSGSMGGVSIQQARFSLVYALQQLSPNDRFNIIEFNNQHRALYTRPVLADRANIASATRFVESLQAGGGTNMAPALAAAMQQPADEAYLRQIIFITDGAVGNEEALFKLIHEQLLHGRLFTIGIGSAPNSYFMRKAADFGRGSFTYIANVAETQERMSELFTKLRSPLSSDLQVQWPASAKVEAYPARVPDLYAGEPLLVSAKLDLLAGLIAVEGRAAEQSWRRELEVVQVGDHAGIATLWGRRKIEHLLDLKAAGGDAESLRGEVLEVALRHQIMSPYTSFVAVEEQISRPPGAALDSAAVPNAQPSGQSPQPYAYPQGATRSQWSLLLGGLLLLLSLIRWFSSHRGYAYVASL